MQSESPESIPVAELVFVNSGTPAQFQRQPAIFPSVAPNRSWLFRLFDGVAMLYSWSFGIVSIILCVAVVANVPVLQLLGFGYLLEVSGRVSRTGKLADAMVGISKASRIGSLLLGTWLLLIPVRFFSDHVWYEAWLIDPMSPQTRFLRVVQIVLIVLVAVQIAMAWMCGGRLRYFFWPLIAPFSFAIWTLRRMMGSRIFRPLLSIFLNWISPHVTNDLVNARPPRDWFVPVILWSKIRRGGLYVSMRDGLWDFLKNLNLWHYFRLGFLGGVGTIAWLALPTLLLVCATMLTPPAAVVAGVFGVLTAIPIFALLPFIQTHFSRSGRLAGFAEIRPVLESFRAAPLAHVFALLLMLAFALPLFLLKIESIPIELLWTLSIVFVLFSWPSRVMVSLAHRRGLQRFQRGRWWIAWPLMSLALPISAMFVLIFSLTRYVSWNGAWSMIENHVFLLPAPFWL